MPRARFFPVTVAPLAMRAGLRPLGTDFGNGPLDRQCFLADEERERYLAAKARVPPRRHGVRVSDPAHAAAHRAALAYAREALERELSLRLPILDDEDAPVLERWRAVSDAVQEDLALLHRGGHDDGCGVAMLVSFPSGWRPERLLGASFASIHGPVPGFADEPRAARSMVRAMVERGPYVRFVWTLSADDLLDHHPDEGGRAPLEAADRGFFRVERQVTVPFPDEGASLFLIRTLLLPFEALSRAERATLHDALLALPDEIARYKGLFTGRARMLELLR